MKTILIYLVLIFLSETAFSSIGDSTAIRKYEENAIMINASGLSSGYIKGGKRIKMGLGFKNLRAEYEKFSPDALKQFNEFKKCQHKTAIWCGAFTMGLVAGAAISVVAPLGAAVAITGSFVSYGIAIKNAIKGTNHFQKSIWLHNRDVLK